MKRTRVTLRNPANDESVVAMSKSSSGLGLGICKARSKIAVLPGQKLGTGWRPRLDERFEDTGITYSMGPASK
jgi:hypothetical protein